jgi:hypothetical protein
MEASDMAIVIRAHYDGKAIVPDEPVDLPVDTPITAELTVIEEKLAPADIKRRLAAWRRFSARAVKGASIPLEALRRENMYEPPRGL